MLDEVTVNKFSQLVYLDLPAAVKGQGPPTVGGLADYYAYDVVGEAHIKARFGGIPEEYEHWRQFLTGGLESVRGFRIRNILDDNRPDGSGFYGCSYLSPQGELVAAFRGSEMLGNRRYQNDYETDFALAYAEQTPQQKLADDYLRAFDDFRTRPYILTGHSLGGNLALSGAARAPEPGLVAACYAFNAPGFGGEFLSANRKGIEAVKPRLFLMQNRHDLVSSLLQNIAEPVILESLFCPRDREQPGVADILYPHSNFLFQTEGESFVRAVENRKDPLCQAVHALTRLLLLLPVFVRKAMADSIIKVIYSAQPPKKQLAFLLEQVTKNMVESGVEAGENLVLCGGLYLAKQMCGSKDAATLYRELYDDGLDEHSRLAGATLLLLRLTQAA